MECIYLYHLVTECHSTYIMDTFDLLTDTEIRQSKQLFLFDDLFANTIM